MSDRVEIGDAVLYRGDALRILPTLDRVDLLFTDPPFELFKTREFIWSYDHACPEHWHNIVMSKFPYTGMVQREFAERPWPLVSEYIWHFTDMSSFRASYMPLIHHETISVFSGRKDAIDLDRIRQPHRRSLAAEPQFKTAKSRGKQGKDLYWQQSEKGAWKSSVIICQRSLTGDMQDKDTTQPVGVKPVEMLMGLLPAYGDGVILDPFMGSGSAAIVAALTGRPYIGIEVDPDYFALAVRRLEDFHRNGDLFV